MPPLLVAGYVIVAVALVVVVAGVIGWYVRRAEGYRCWDPNRSQWARGGAKSSAPFKNVAYEWGRPWSVEHNGILSDGPGHDHYMLRCHSNESYLLDLNDVVDS